MEPKIFVIFLTGILLFGFSHSKTNFEKRIQNPTRNSMVNDVKTAIQNRYRIPRYIWWNHYENGPLMKMLMEKEEREEKLKEKEQEKRNKIYRNKLVNRIRSSVLRDFWANRY